MTPSERRATFVLAAILILRMTALFMVLPVLAPYALALAGSPVFAVGLAVGAYGLTQAALQLPFGWLSDRVGRKPVIAGGLLIFIVGSALAALAPDIETLVLARLLQGGGAIAAASTALLSDLTRDSVRTTAMAIVGASIGGAFLLALVLGPALLSLTDVPGLFWVAAGAACLALGLLLLLPDAPRPTPAPAATSSVLRGDLLSLDLGVLCLHAMLSSVFLGLPLLLESEWHWSGEQHWKLYLPVMLASLVPVFPMIRWLEKRQRVVQVMPLAVISLVLAVLWLAVGGQLLPAALWLFFCAFTFLEASLPSQVARLAPAAMRGRAMGLFSSAQFFGAFAGAASGGIVLAHWGAAAVLASAALWGALWVTLLFVRNELDLSFQVFKPADSAVAADSHQHMTASRKANESRN